MTTAGTARREADGTVQPAAQGAVGEDETHAGTQAPTTSGNPARAGARTHARTTAWAVSTSGPSLLDERRGPAGVQRALRHLVSACRSEGRALPLMPVVTVGDGVLEAHLAAPLGRAPAPWSTHGHVWSVEIAGLPRRGDELDAYPALVEVGRQHRRAVFVDLAAAPGLVEIDGPAAEVGDLLVTIAAGLLRAPWSREVRVWTSGARSVADRRVRPIARLSEVVAPAPVEVGGVRGRWGTPPRGSHDVVILGRPVDEDEHRLIRSASRLRGAPTVIAPGRGRGVWQWHLQAGVMTW